MHTHLTSQEREVISQMHFAGHSNGAIARKLGRASSTIGRELTKNAASDGSYSACRARQQATGRRRQRPRVRKMDDPDINTYVRMRLTQRWSPDQIAGRLKREHPHPSRRRVSHQTIYDWIKQDDDRVHWESLLRRGGRARPQRDRGGKLPAQVSIGNRPHIVDSRRPCVSQRPIAISSPLWNVGRVNAIANSKSSGAAARGNSIATIDPFPVRSAPTNAERVRSPFVRQHRHEINQSKNGKSRANNSK